MNEKEKKRLIIIGSIVAVIVALFFLFRGNGAATVIQRPNGAGQISIPGMGPITLNGDDSRLVYTPGALGGNNFQLPSLGGLISGSINRLPSIMSPNNNQSASPNCGDCSGQGVDYGYAVATASQPIPGPYIPPSVTGR